MWMSAVLLVLLAVTSHAGASKSWEFIFKMCQWNAECEVTEEDWMWGLSPFIWKENIHLSSLREFKQDFNQVKP